MFTLSDFKKEYRGICTDLWGNALDAWFEAAGQMFKRGLNIPSEWEYFPGMAGDGTESECYWYEVFENISNELLIEIGNFLFRYCEYLRFKEMNY